MVFKIFETQNAVNCAEKNNLIQPEPSIFPVILYNMDRDFYLYVTWAFCKSTSHIPANIPHPKHPTSCPSHIPNIPHPEHPTSQTSHIPQHPTSPTSHIPNIPHPKHPTSRTSHIPNIPHPQHPTSPTSHIPYIPHSTFSICHFPSISHSEHVTSCQTNHIT